MQRNKTSIGRAIDNGTNWMQVLDNVNVSILAGHVEWCETIRIGSIHYGTALDEEFAGLQVTVFSRNAKNVHENTCLSVYILQGNKSSTCFLIWIGTIGYQKLSNLLKKWKMQSQHTKWLCSQATYKE